MGQTKWQRASLGSESRSRRISQDVEGESSNAPITDVSFVYADNAFKDINSCYGLLNVVVQGNLEQEIVSIIIHNLKTSATKYFEVSSYYRKPL